MPIPWAFIIPAAASLISNYASGRSQGRANAAATNLNRDQLSTQQYGTNQNALMQAMMGGEAANMNRARLDLDRRNFSLDAPNRRAATSVRGDVMSRSQPLKIDFQKGQIPQFSGGPSLGDLSPESRQLGQSMTRNALMQQLQGDTFEDVPQQDWKGGVLKPPSQTPLPQPTGIDTFLNIAAPIAGGLAAGGQAQQGSQNMTLIQELLRQAMQGNGASSVNAGLPPPTFNPNLNMRW